MSVRFWLSLTLQSLVYSHLKIWENQCFVSSKLYRRLLLNWLSWPLSCKKTWIWQPKCKESVTLNWCSCEHPLYDLCIFDPVSVLFSFSKPCQADTGVTKLTVGLYVKDCLLNPLPLGAYRYSSSYCIGRCFGNGEEEDPDHPDRRWEEPTGQCPQFLLSSYMTFLKLCAVWG